MTYRVLTVGAIAAFTVAGPAGPALAHVEVSADKAQAGATEVTLTFTGEAENPAAGIASERVVLPAGIAPADVTLVEAPSGWTFTRGSDGFTVGGRALRTGADATWKVKVARLPADQTRLSFKTLETYGNGDISRWIEIQQPGEAEPDNPAPLVTLKPAAAASPSSAGATAAPPVTSAAPSPTPTTAAAQTSTSTGGSAAWVIWPIIALVVIAAALWLLRRRRGTDAGS